ncbi:MAG TPA: hypothetical protein DCM28_13620 [Phycisphaerales bacterium]|nr:hypothetical protein [Phycisphaerales bacterium]HCD33995.1 hypothetical protein [Phycisphaerales bacterium]|tara:strand:+ start:51477 stop:52985 length:1509 start_codon:yes stop_codon:yes gene_type:complete
MSLRHILLIALCFASITFADQLIPEHGKYSTQYQSDWSTLPTGDVLAKHDLSKIPFKQVNGEEVRQVFANQDAVHVKDLNYKVHWDRPVDKYKSTLIYIANVKEVVLENINIINTDPDYKAYHSILVEGADRVIVRNLYLAGTVQSYHLRLEGCGEIFIENVEIAGVQYDNRPTHRLGGGIFINNGASGRGGINNTGLRAEHPRIPGWQVIQNCYIHDNSQDDDHRRNQDGILIHAPSNGLLFNTVVENWLRPSGDSAFDLGFRRVEPEYQDKTFRVERNIIRNCTFLKTPGRGTGPNTLFLTNNILINTTIGDYHGGGGDNRYVHNTFIYDLNQAPQDLRQLALRGSQGFSCLWNFAGRTFYHNNLVYRPAGDFFMFYMNDQGDPQKYRQVYADNNVYAIDPIPSSYLRSAVKGLKVKTFEDWKKDTAQDTGSLVVKPATVPFVSYDSGDFRLTHNPWPNATQLHDRKIEGVRLSVLKDFDGKARDTAHPTAGAFEAPLAQ